LIAVKNNGGLAIIQSPQTAEVSYMPEFAIKNVAVDHILSPAEIALFIKGLV
jgi:two-component system chemotaxis response regulator CheB